jgi:hypothetical protein
MPIGIDVSKVLLILFDFGIDAAAQSSRVRARQMQKQKQNKVGEPQQNAVENSFFTYAQFARRMNVCTATIRRMALRGELKRIVINSRLVRVPASELARLGASAI